MAIAIASAHIDHSSSSFRHNATPVAPCRIGPTGTLDVVPRSLELWRGAGVCLEQDGALEPVLDDVVVCLQLGTTRDVKAEFAVLKSIPFGEFHAATGERNLLAHFFVGISTIVRQTAR